MYAGYCFRSLSTFGIVALEIEQMEEGNLKHEHVFT